MGETGYGRGEMAHLLLKGDRKMHKQIAVVATYIIRYYCKMNPLSHLVDYIFFDA